MATALSKEAMEKRAEKSKEEWLEAKGVTKGLGAEVKLPDHRWIVAVDFGTDGTGFAFAERTGKDIFINKNWDDGPSSSYKTRTSILLDAQGNCLAFGSHAETKYIKMKPKKAKDVFFFQTVKMALYTTWNHKSVSSDIVLTASNGKTMKAMDVFAAALRYIQQCLVKHIQNSTGHVLQPTDVLYVLTVPAIWSDAAKQFMRMCAYQAGLVSPTDPDRLILALEPEVAGLYCRKLPAADFIGKGATSGIREPIPGDSYVIVDAGGGTVDIAVHEVDAMGHVKEIYQPSGGPWGGKLFNDKLLGLLGKIFGTDVIDYVTEHHPAGLADTIKQIEDVKKIWQPSEDEDVQLKLNFDFREAINSVEGLVTML